MGGILVTGLLLTSVHQKGEREIDREREGEGERGREGERGGRYFKPKFRAALLKHYDRIGQIAEC